MAEEWKRLLRADPTAWLLEKSDPSGRYFTLVRLLDRQQDDPDVRAAREAIEDSDRVRTILDAQRPAGYWDRDKRAYLGVTNYLMALEFLGHRGNDERVHKAIEYLLADAQRDDGAFGCDGPEGGRGEVIPCFTANGVRLLHWFGYGEDPRTVKALEYLLRTQREDGGWLCTERVKKTHACFWATAKALRALEVLPSDQQTAQVREAVQRAVSLFLDRGLYRHHSEFGKVSPHWFQFARPLFVSTDVLEILTLVAPHVSPDDQRIEEGLNLVLEKQDQRGRWPSERKIPVKKTFPIPFDEVGQPSKWVTLNALVMLRQLYSSAA